MGNCHTLDRSSPMHDVWMRHPVIVCTDVHMIVQAVYLNISLGSINEFPWLPALPSMHHLNAREPTNNWIMC
jgi:hypothetical protein